MHLGGKSDTTTPSTLRPVCRQNTENFKWHLSSLSVVPDFSATVLRFYTALNQGQIICSCFKIFCLDGCKAIFQRLFSCTVHYYLYYIELWSARVNPLPILHMSLPSQVKISEDTRLLGNCKEKKIDIVHTFSFSRLVGLVVPPMLCKYETFTAQSRISVLSISYSFQNKQILSGPLTWRFNSSGGRRWCPNSGTMYSLFSFCHSH